MSEAQDAMPESLANLRRVVARKRNDELEAAWLAAMTDTAVPAEELIGTLRVLVRRGESEQVEGLLWFWLDALAEQRGPEAALAVVRMGAGLPAQRAAQTTAGPDAAPGGAAGDSALSAKSEDAMLPDGKTIREEAAGLYRQVRADAPNIETFLKMTVLRTDVPLSRGVALLERLLELRPGQYVFDAEKKAPGRIESIDADRAVIVVSFEGGAQDFDAVAMERLERIAPDDYRARVVFEREALVALASSDPAALVEQALRSHGPFLAFRDMKTVLAPVVPASAWTKWWGAAKGQLKRAPMIHMSDAAQPSFGLRTKAIAYEDDVRRQFAAAESVESKLAVALDYVTDVGAGAHPADAGLMNHLAAALAAMADRSRKSEPVAAAAALTLLAEMKRLAPDAVAMEPPPVASILFPDGKGANIPGGIQDERLARFAFARIRAATAERWAEAYGCAMAGCSTEACEWLAGELVAAGEGAWVARAVPAILARPDANAPALMWLWRSLGSERFGGALAEIDGSAVLVRMIGAVDALRKTGEVRGREAASAVVKALSAKDYAQLRAVLARSADDQVRLARGQVERSTGLTDHARNQLLEVIRRTRPGLFAKVLQPWEEDVIYTTAEGLKRREAELHEIVNVKLPAASKAVGTAAADGDLSENFAWTAALAERDRLGTVATRMQEELRKARVIPPSLGKREAVTVGSAVDVKDQSSGETKTFTFFGPWDSDNEHGIFAYTATVGVAFMGKKKGDMVTLQMSDRERTWEILDVRPGLSAKEE